MDDLTRNGVVLLILKAAMRNNELRHDLTKGQALSKGEYGPMVGRIFDLADAVMAEKVKRDEA